MNARTTIADGAPLLQRDLDDLFQALGARGIEASLQERLNAHALVFALGFDATAAADWANADGVSRLQSHLKPAIAKTPAAGIAFDEAFAEWAGQKQLETAERPVSPFGPLPPKKRAFATRLQGLADQYSELLAILMVLVSLGILVWVWPAREGASGPVAETGAASPIALDNERARETPSITTAPAAPTAPVGPAPGQSADVAEVLRILRAIETYSVMPTPREAGRIVSEETGGSADAESVAAELVRTLSVGPDKPMRLYDFATRAQILGVMGTLLKPGAALDPFDVQQRSVAQDLLNLSKSSKVAELALLTQIDWSPASDSQRRPIQLNASSYAQLIADLRSNRTSAQLRLTLDESEYTVVIQWSRDSGGAISVRGQASPDVLLVLPFKLGAANGADLVRLLDIAGLLPPNITSVPWRTAPPPVEEFKPAWWWSLAAFPLLGALYVAFRRQRALQAFLRRRRYKGDTIMREIRRRAERLMRISDARLRIAAQRLAVRTAVPSQDIDVEATIDQAIPKAGFAVPVPGVLRPRAEYVAVIQARVPRDQEGARMDRLARQLDDLGLAVTRYHFMDDLRRLTSPHASGGIGLGELAIRHPHARLVLFCDARILYNPNRRTLWDWAQDLTAWERRALLTPRPAMEWEAAELLAARDLGLRMGRATPEGLAQLPELLNLDGREREIPPAERPGGDRPLPSALQRPDADLIDSVPPEPLDGRALDRAAPGDNPGADEIVDALQRYLGPRGFQWLAACAIYPAMQWEMTLYLGAMLQMPVGNSSDRRTWPYLFDESILASLTRLPWFRIGFMPDWLRRSLIDAMDPVIEADARKLLLDLLADEGASPATEDDTVTLRVAQRRRTLRSVWRSGPGQDAVFVEFLTKKERSRLDLALPSWLRRYAAIASVVRFIGARWLELGAGAGLSAASAFMLWEAGPAPSTAALSPVAALAAAMIAGYALAQLLLALASRRGL